MRQLIYADGVTYVADYIYHENGTPMAFAYYQQGSTPVYYFYETNLQGDIIAIYDENGSKVVGFRYDAWGSFNTDISNSTVCTDTFLRASLFRYRSYIYDYETSFYYLQSRYYDYEIGRFINADDIDYLGIGHNELLSYNLYSYASNNPIMGIDPEGNISWKTLLGVGAALVIVGVVLVIAAPVAATAIGTTVAVTSTLGSKLVLTGIAVTTISTIGTSIENVGSNVYTANAGDGISEHTNGHKNWDKHSKKRPGSNEKKDKVMKPRINKKKRNLPKIKNRKGF